MTNFYYFTYEGYDFRISDWYVDDFSDFKKGRVEIKVDDNWDDIISYEHQENYDCLHLCTGRTEEFFEGSNFYFSDDDITDFIERNVISVEHFVKYELGQKEIN